jgi:hypothetical protein
MPLYTVRIDFEDRTFAIEQVVADTAQQALDDALRHAEAMANYERSEISALIEHVRITQLADVVGVWNWCPAPRSIGEAAEVYGGTIVQTDSEGSTRTDGS